MMKDPFRIQVNGQHEFELLPEQATAADVIPEGEGLYHLLMDARSHHIELVEADYAARQYSFRIHGEKYAVHISDQYERLVQQLGLHLGGGHRQNAVKAPMPGLVVEVLVKAGQSVTKGDALLILEAMKMENVLKAADDGTVKAVKVVKGAAVDKGHLLLEME